MKENTTVAIYDSHSAAEEAVKHLQRAGFDLEKLSIVGKDFETEEQVTGFYNTGDRVKYWGKLGAFWGGLWGLLVGAAFFWIPGIGALAAAGPVVSWIIGALETAAFVGGLSALGAALFSIGIPKNSVLNYETAVRIGKFLLVAHGTPEEVSRAKELLRQSDAEEINVHHAGEATAMA